MQKKILSSVIALCLVGSTSVAFAGGYWSQPSVDVEIEDSFNKTYTNNSEKTLNVKKYSDNDFSKTYEYDYTKTITKDSHENNSKSLDLDLDIDVEKNYNSHNITQGNKVKGHIVIQQFGGAAGGSGDVISQDNSINHSIVGSYNADDSFNTEDSYNKEYNSTKNYTSTKNYSRTSNYTSDKDIDLDVEIDDSFNYGSNNKSYTRMSFPKRVLMAPQ